MASKYSDDPVEAQRFADLGFPGEAEAVEIPASNSLPQGTEPSLFDSPEVDTGGSLFDDLNVNEVSPPPAVARPLTASMLALAGGAWKSHPAIALGEENLRIAQEALDGGAEFAERMKIAQNRSIRMLSSIDRLKENLKSSAGDPLVTQGYLNKFDEAYTKVTQEKLEDKAATALEYETVENIQDLLTAGNTVEAKVTWDLYDKGNAQKIMHDEGVKNLIMAQRIQELESEYQDSSWPRAIANFVIGAIPGKGNFDRSGIMDDAKIANDAGGLINWFLTGNNLEKQGDALWQLDPQDFAKAMAKDGPVMQAIRENAGLFLDDPGVQLEVMKALNYQSDSDKLWANVWGVVDPLTLVPWSKAASIPKTLVSLGARKAATAKVADAYTQLLQKGGETAFKTTGIKEAEVVSHLEPTALNTIDNIEGMVPLSVDVSSELDAAAKILEDLPSFISPSRFTNESELAAAYEAASDAIKVDFGETVKDVAYKIEDVRTGQTYDFAGSIPEQGNVTHTVEVTFGKKGGGGYAKEETAQRALGSSGYEGEVFRDASGQYFYKSKFNIREEGFITAPLETNSGNILNILRSNARLSDPSVMGKALVAGNNANAIRQAMHKKLTDTLKGVSKEDKGWVDQIIRLGQNKSKWFTDDDFIYMYQRAAGRDPSPKVIATYQNYKRFNDVDYLLRNDSLYVAKARKGAESVEFQIGANGLHVDVDAVIDLNPTMKPLREVWDASKGVLLDSPSADDIKKMSGDGYVLVKALDDVRLPDGEVARSFMIKKSDLQRRPLRRTQLGYSEGGHRAYTGKYFVKQASRDSKNRLLNPAVYITGNNKNVLADWAKTMNKARLAVKDGVGRDAQWLDDNVFMGQKGYPTGEDFLKEVEAKRMSLDDAVEVVYDREMPKAYQEMRDDVLNFVDPEETAVEGFYRTTGRMYFGRKGEHLNDAFGEFAETVDPWETLNTALDKITRTTTLTNYKINALERFKKTYGPALELKNLENTEGLYDLVNARIKAGFTDQSIIRKVQNEQNALKRILSFETGEEKFMRQTSRNIGEWVLGSSKGGSRELAYNAWEWLAKNNPVNALRSFAFDSKLGLWNWGQLPIQMTTMLASTALSPKYGFKGMGIAGPMMAWKSLGSDPRVLDVLAQNGVWKMGGFDSVQEFKGFAKLLDESGMLAVDNTHALINTYGSNRVFGAASKFQRAREMGRAFFYAAEKGNRSVAARIAYGEAKERGLEVGSAKFKEEFVRLTDDYSMNMMSESTAGFQTGILSIPTQFWGYSIRMMDAMMGKRFTNEQKSRLIFSQIVLGGTAGIPLGEQMSNYYQQLTGAPIDIEDNAAWVDRGVVDKFMNYATGVDMQFGEKIGTGGVMMTAIKDLFGMGDYGEKSTAEMLAGATGSITMAAGPALVNVVKYAVAESGGETGMPLTEDALMGFAREISTFNNHEKALSVYNYGIYKTKKGMIQVDGLPSESAFFIAAGINPQAIDTMNEMTTIQNKDDEAVKTFAKKLDVWRQEAFTNKDKYEENMTKANALMQMIPEELRQPVRDQQKKITDPSLYAKIARQWEEEKVQKQIVEEATN